MERTIFLTSDFDLVEDLPKEAEASAISLNPFVSWARFVFTDDQPNKNKQRIPIDEYPNILKTGILMPIKMAVGRINDGHEDAVPLGTIAQLKVEGNKVIGLAALWIKERPEDVSFLKTKTDPKPQLSWEVLYDSAIKDESGIDTLQGVVVRASTIVGLPAYSGRTPIEAIASDNSEENKVTLEELQAQYAELKKKLDDTLSELASTKTQLSEKEASLTSQAEEITQLKTFKETVEKEKANTEKMASIEKLFADSNLKKDKTYFEERKDKFLALEQSEIDFMVQELVASLPSTSNASANTNTIPNLILNGSIPSDPRELGRLLRTTK